MEFGDQILKAIHDIVNENGPTDISPEQLAERVGTTPEVIEAICWLLRAGHDPFGIGEVLTSRIEYTHH